MTPEEAKPHQIYREEPSGGHGGSRKADYPTPMFTAKETAEIAKAYAEAYYYEDVSFDSKPAAAWREKFEGWSK